MGNISNEIKLEYIKRFEKGETAKILGKEVSKRFSLEHNSAPHFIIYRWVKDEEKGKFETDWKDSRGLNRREIKRGNNKEFTSQYFKDNEINIKFLEYFVNKHSEALMSSDKKIKFLAIYNDNELPKTTLFKIFGVSSSAYYKWMKEKKIGPNYDDELLSIINHTFLKYRVFGRRRIKIALERDHQKWIDVKTVDRDMRKLDIKSPIRQKGKSTYREGKDTKFFLENLVGGEYIGAYYGEKIFTDITQIKTLENTLFLSIFIDGYSQEVISFICDDKAGISIVTPSLNEIIKLRKRIKRDIIIHSDHGTEYTSLIIQRLAKENGIKWSLSRVGNSLDNRPSEYFFSILKTEYTNQFEGKIHYWQMEEFIKNSMWHYNNIRFQGNLNNMTPVEFKKKKTVHF